MAYRPAKAGERTNCELQFTVCEAKFTTSCPDIPMVLAEAAPASWNEGHLHSSSPTFVSSDRF
jgi:hypothetical protein